MTPAAAHLSPADTTCPMFPTCADPVTLAGAPPSGSELDPPESGGPLRPRFASVLLTVCSGAFSRRPASKSRRMMTSSPLSFFIWRLEVGCAPESVARVLPNGPGCDEDEKRPFRQEALTFLQ